MTAELSDVFATKRDGVTFILESIRSCFPDLAVYVLNLSGQFMPVCEALAHPLDYAATNWLASAQWVARKYPECLMVDVGSTTTDILPILDGKLNVVGRTDMARLSLRGTCVHRCFADQPGGDCSNGACCRALLQGCFRVFCRKWRRASHPGAPAPARLHMRHS